MTSPKTGDGKLMIRRYPNRGDGKDATCTEVPSAALDEHVVNTPPCDDACWFLDSLRCLGYDKPEDFLPALSHCDEALIQLTLWLEDHIIRLLTIEKREALRCDYWTMISEYLEELKCPMGYFSAQWQNNAALRVRVLFFLLSVAMSEAYGDAFIDDPPPSATEPDSMPNNLRMVDYTNYDAISSISESDLDQIQSDEFPLGFSSGDSQVDRLLVVLRMNLLLDLENEQQFVNQRIAQLQAMKAHDAKPLKKYKQRRRGR